jgi:hypothetical protein
MRPRIFIGSSIESLDISYAIQENLEHFADVTVWDQSIFDLSKYALDSLIDTLDKNDFGTFVFSPDDLAVIRNQEKQIPRDNVIFELGLFIGRLGKERCFIIIPRGHKDFHSPTDLAGLTTATFEPNRQDRNLNAALGPACNKIKKVVDKFGIIKGQKNENNKAPITYNENDKKAIIESWMGSRPASDNLKVIYFNKVDQELGLEPGSIKKYIKEIASRWNYIVSQEGESTILLKEAPHSRVISKGIRSRWMDSY